MTWSPSEPRLPAGMPSGGQWGTVSAKPATSRSTAAGKAKPKGKTTAAHRAGGSRKPGPARNAAAAKVQANPAAQKLYSPLIGGNPAQRTAYVKGLSTNDLKLLTQIAYSSKTSDPNVVHARITVANEMTRRGVPIQSYGALGGGISPSRAATLKKVAAVKAASKTKH